MKKLILLSLMMMSLTSVFAQDLNSVNEESRRGCRRWYISIGSWTILEHSNDACGNPDGNWDWFPN